MKMKDERIEKGSNALAAKLLPLMLVLQAIVLGGKLALGGWRFCLLDVIALAAGLGTAAVLLTAKGVWRADDDALREIRNACLSRAFGTMLMVLVVGEFVCTLADEANLLWYAPSIIVWLVPALIMTVLVIRRGLFQWGTKKAEKNGKARLAGSTAIGALFFGVMMGGEKCIVDGAFDPKGLLWVLGMGASWGILFYLMFTLMLKLGGKQADKAMEQAAPQEMEEGENVDEADA